MRPNEPNVVELVMELMDFNQERMAKRLGVSQQAVSEWLRRGRFGRQVAEQVEVITKGAVTARMASPTYNPEEETSEQSTI